MTITIILRYFTDFVASGAHRVKVLEDVVVRNPGLINFANIKILFMILKPKFMEPEVGVVIRY